MANNRPRYEEALNRGAMYRSRQMWQEAFSAYRVAIAEFPNEATPYAGLGEACLGLKQLDRALDCFKLAAKYSNGDMTYLKRVADIQERQGQLSEAAKTYTAAGEYLMRRNEMDEAVGNWERAIRLDPTLLGPHRRLAMIFQRQDKRREAVREYLAIARILQTQGDQQKAFQMCQAALRLDPGNRDVLTAVALIRHGAEGFAEPEPQELALPTISEAEQAEADALTETVRQMAAIFEAEARQKQSATAVNLDRSDPVFLASRLAQEQLSEEIFREEDDKDAAVTRRTGLSKLERDALIGQAMDFESRRQTDEAIRCYERAMAGGLTMAAAYFNLGLLYLQKGNFERARRVLGAALKDPAYTEAVKQAYARSQKPA